MSLAKDKKMEKAGYSLKLLDGAARFSVEVAKEEAARLRASGYYAQIDCDSRRFFMWYKLKGVK